MGEAAPEGVTQTTHRVRAARANEHGDVVDVLVEAFQRDPLAQWLFPDEARRRREHRAYFTDVVDEAAQGGDPIDVTDDLLAAAIWKPPGRPRDFDPPPDGTADAVALFGAVRTAAPPLDTWYLSFIGTRQSGMGGGGALLRSGLARTTGPTTLWTGNGANLTFYGKHGFAVTSRQDVPGASAWWLARAARRRPPRC